MSAAAPSRIVAPATSPVPAAPRPERGRPIRDVGTTRRASVHSVLWTTRGLAKVEGEVDVGRGDADGLTAIAGRLVADTFRSRGTLEVFGATDVRELLTVDGMTRLGGPAHAGELEARGTLHLDADLAVDRALFARGLVEAPNVRAALVDLGGAAEIPGRVTGTAVVRGRFDRDTNLGSVEAPRVAFQGPPTSLIPTLWRAVFGGGAEIRIGRIEAETVELAAVDAELVRARSISLGPGAHVTTVEGTVVRKDPTSRVGPESRSPRPHGLSR